MDALAELLNAALRAPQPVRKLTLGFNELRALVVGTYDKGESLKEYGGTFSHGNSGNSFQDLALKVDELVSNGEPNKNFVIQFEEDIFERERLFTSTLDHIQGLVDELKIATDNKNRHVAELQSFVDGVKQTTGTFGLGHNYALLEITKSFDKLADLEDFKLGVKSMLGMKIDTPDDMVISKLERMSRPKLPKGLKPKKSGAKRR